MPRRSLPRAEADVPQGNDTQTVTPDFESTRRPGRRAGGGSQLPAKLREALAEVVQVYLGMAIRGRSSATDVELVRTAALTRLQRPDVIAAVGD